MTETEEPLIESLVGWNISNPDEYLQGNFGTGRACSRSGREVSSRATNSISLNNVTHAHC
jgi:hypothetical protein